MRYSQKPVYLAGGLGPDNVAQAIDQVQPYGVDLCSGVRSGGNLEPGLLKDFIHRVHAQARH